MYLMLYAMHACDDEKAAKNAFAAFIKLMKILVCKKGA